MMQIHAGITTILLTCLLFQLFEDTSGDDTSTTTVTTLTTKGNVALNAQTQLPVNNLHQQQNGNQQMGPNNQHTPDNKNPASQTGGDTTDKPNKNSTVPKPGEDLNDRTKSTTQSPPGSSASLLTGSYASFILVTVTGLCLSEINKN